MQLQGIGAVTYPRPNCFKVQKPKKSRFSVNIHAADMSAAVWKGPFAADLDKIRNKKRKWASDKRRYAHDDGQA